MIDCAAYIGQYPFRHLPHPEPDVLVRVLERENLSGAWVGYLPSAWHRDPAPGNDALLAALAPYREVLRPAPVVRPDWPQWEKTLRNLVEDGAAAIRSYPMQWGMAPHDATLLALALACGEIGVPLVLTVRFWVWGPPEDHFAHLLRSVGAERFVYGTHWPLRLVQNPRANLDLLPEDLRLTAITDARTLEK